MKNKTCFVIVGPTAVGKTSFAIRLAKHFNTQIISADSRQCYKELNIGVAKPSPDELAEVTHHFINSNTIFDEVNAKEFEEYALQKADDIFKEHDVAVMVGGTGLYVKAFCEGIDEVPDVDAVIKNEIITNYNNRGFEWLESEIEKIDPIYFSNGEIKNPQRMMRALEVKLSTGRSILEFHSSEKKKRYFKIIKIGLQLGKEQLHQNINNRVDRMMQHGLLNEVRSLLPYEKLNALQTVGYRELFDHLNGKISLEEAIEKIKINTRQYAKRQMTWFRKDKEVEWVDVGEAKSVSEVCGQLYLRNSPIQNTK
jgi:tRNA dimethylallyltransferase